MRPVTALRSTVKVDSETHTVYVDEHLEDLEGVDELRAELSEHQPRFVIYSCKIEHSDGRVSYPMVFIFSTPKGATGEDLSGRGRARRRGRSVGGGRTYRLFGRN